MLDEAQATAMRNVADRDPKNVESRVQLGNLYFDAQRYHERSSGTKEALALNPADANVSTDLAVSYYYTDQTDKALAQFERSLKTDPTHVKTYLNMGVVQAFGKQDLKAAAAAWEEVLKLAPQHRGAGGQALARQPQRGASRGLDRAAFRAAGRQVARRRAMLTRFLLWALFLMVLFRAIGRLVRGIAEGAGVRPKPGPAPGPGRPSTPAKGELMARDPVCGTYVVPSTALSARGAGGLQYFCSDKCRQAYLSR